MTIRASVKRQSNIIFYYFKRIFKWFKSGIIRVKFNENKG